MYLITMINFFCGTTLGLRFKVLVLVPCTFIDVIAVIILSGLRDEWLMIPARAVAISLTLQLGYATALMIRRLAGELQGSRHFPACGQAAARDEALPHLKIVDPGLSIN